MQRILLLSVLLMSCQTIFAQRVKEEAVDYQYIQLPMAPVDKSITNYQSSVTATYQEENDKKTAEYEAEKAKAQAEYDAKVAALPAAQAAADAQYLAEVKAYDEKSLAEKVVENKLLNEGGKPVKKTVPTPYKRNVSEPKLKTAYDTEALAGTYLGLDGFVNSADNAIKIEVSINGFEYTKPVRKSVKKKVTTSAGQVTETHYYNEFTYRHTMSVKVTGPAGKTLLFVTPSDLNTYTVYATKAQKATVPINEEQLVSEFETKVLQANLELISGLVNDHVGYKRTDRTGTMFFVKEKKDEYTDLMIAYNTASTGLNMLIDNEEAGKTTILEALAIYETAMLESEPKNKKARINGKIIMPLYFAMIECYWAIGDMAKVDALMSELNAMPLVRKEKTKKEEYQAIVTDTKARLKANGL